MVVFILVFRVLFFFFLFSGLVFSGNELFDDEFIIVVDSYEINI